MMIIIRYLKRNIHDDFELRREKKTGKIKKKSIFKFAIFVIDCFC